MSKKKSGLAEEVEIHGLLLLGGGGGLFGLARSSGSGSSCRRGGSTASTTSAASRLAKHAIETQVSGKLNVCCVSLT